jgi:hypothetical protein
LIEYAPPRQLKRWAASTFKDADMNYGLLLLLFSLLPAGNQARQCTCQPAPPQEQTRWGNDNVVLSTVTRVRVSKGVVTDLNGQPVPTALVEIFTDPEVRLPPYSPEREARRGKQRRIAACFTDPAGKFCFGQLPAGRYELRCSAEGFQIVSQTIVVDVKRRAGKQINVTLPVAT